MPGQTRYAWCDSSPQAERDWIISKEMSIRNDMIVTVAEAVDALIDASMQDGTGALLFVLSRISPSACS